MAKQAAASLVLSVIVCAGPSLNAAPVFVMRGSAAGPATINPSRGTALTARPAEPSIAATSRSAHLTSSGQANLTVGRSNLQLGTRLLGNATTNVGRALSISSKPEERQRARDKATTQGSIGVTRVLRGSAAMAAGAGKSVAGKVSGVLGNLGDRLKITLRGGKPAGSTEATLKEASATGTSKKTPPDLGKPSHVEKKIQPIKLSSVSFAKKVTSSHTSFAQGILDKYMGPPGKTETAVLKANQKDLAEAKAFRQKANTNYAKAYAQWQAGEKSGRARYAADRQLRAAERREWRVAKRQKEQFLRERRAAPRCSRPCPEP